MGGKRLARLLLLSAALLAARAQEDGDVAEAVEAEPEAVPTPSFLVISKARPERTQRTAQHPAHHAAPHPWPQRRACVPRHPACLESAPPSKRASMRSVATLMPFCRCRA
jgi:hypothetical protein